MGGYCNFSDKAKERNSFIKTNEIPVSFSDGEGEFLRVKDDVARIKIAREQIVKIKDRLVERALLVVDSEMN